MALTSYRVFSIFAFYVCHRGDDNFISFEVIDEITQIFIIFMFTQVMETSSKKFLSQKINYKDLSHVV